MRKSLMIAGSCLALAAGGAGAAALAQNAATTPAPPTENAAPSASPQPARHWMGMGGWHHRGRGFAERARQMPFAPGTFALFARQPDKHLSAADVQTIAQAILLWNGQHEWKVTQVEPGQNNQVTFAYAAPDGTVIAKFAINQDTGRIDRVG
jgi:hypothetical protein